MNAAIAITWAVSCLSLLGVILNIRKNPVCFVLWSVTNSMWAILDWAHGLYAQSVLMAVYFGLSIWGLHRWTKTGSVE